MTDTGSPRIREDFLLTPLRHALERTAFVDRHTGVTVDVLAPPYPCAGVGLMRVVRALEWPAGIELCVAYEGYDRL